MNTVHHDEITDADYLYICALLQWGAARLVRNGEDELNDCIRAMEKFAFRLGSAVRRPR